MAQPSRNLLDLAHLLSSLLLLRIREIWPQTLKHQACFYTCAVAEHGLSVFRGLIGAVDSPYTNSVAKTIKHSTINLLDFDAKVDTGCTTYPVPTFAHPFVGSTIQRGTALSIKEPSGPCEFYLPHPEAA